MSLDEFIWSRYLVKEEYFCYTIYSPYMSKIKHVPGRGHNFSLEVETFLNK